MPTINYRRAGGHVAYRANDGSAEPSRTIEGYALLFGTESAPFVDTPRRHVVEIIERGAVDQALLDQCDIKMTYDHSTRHLLARSVGGEGTLSYWVDDRGVGFRFDAPQTTDGDMVLELVKRGDLRGCSFSFSTDYCDANHVAVERSTNEAGREYVIIRLRKFDAIYDFAITPDPAYPDTSVEARSLPASLLEDIDTHEEEETPAEATAEATSTALRSLRRLNKRII